MAQEPNFFSPENNALHPVSDAPQIPGAPPRVWAVGALCRAVADALDARFNPVAVRGEITGLSRAASGHCYFSLKDDSGQIRCAMFRRAASLLGFVPRDGELVEVRGRLGVYEQRGDLQLIVESMSRAGQGALFEQFVRLKAQLESEGLFDSARKRPVPPMPRGIGIVTSLGAAALHDVATALVRRVPHIPVWIAPASVQGANAPQELCVALSKLYLLAPANAGLAGDLASQKPVIDVILLVRGGGSIEDLWAFNDAHLARTIVQSPVPIISGVGHETDFTIADFCADLRAPTPTAAAELCAVDASVLRGAVDQMQERFESTVQTALDDAAQRLDTTAQRLGRPSDVAAQAQLQVQRLGQSLRFGVLSKTQLLAPVLTGLERDLTVKTRQMLHQQHQRLDRAQRSLDLLNPQHVLERGYAWVSNAQGRLVRRVQDVAQGDVLQVHMADGRADVVVQQISPV